MSLLTDADNPTIRALIDLSVDETVLPDTTINLPVFRDAAEAEVETRDPLWTTRTGTDLTHLRNAAMLLTAALLLPSVPQLTSERVADGSSYQRESVDVAARVGELRARAEVEIAAVLDAASLTAARPQMFAAARGWRGR